MRFREFSYLVESTRGIIGTVIDTQDGRGEVFVTPDGREIKAVNSWIFPQDDRLRYEPSSDPDEDSVTMDDELEFDLQDEANLNLDNVKWVGGQKFSTGFAALVVELESDQGRQWVGKYFAAKQASGHLFWQVGEFIKQLKQVGIDVERKRAVNSKAVSGNLKLTPKDLGLTEGTMNINNIVRQVKSHITRGDTIPPDEQNTVIDLIENLGGRPVPCNPEYKTNYQVQLGEVVQPIALVRGINVSGSIKEAEDQLLGYLEPGLKFNAIEQVEYPDNIAEKLFDSYLITPSGKRIGISTKDKSGGAAASVTSAIETLENKMDLIEDKNPDFQNEFAEEIKYLDLIKKSTGRNVVYNLAAEMNIISDEVAREAYELMTSDPTNVEKLKEIDNGSFYDLTINYNGYKPRTDHPLYRVSYHAAASLARIVSARFNSDVKKVTRFFANILEASNMLQVLTDFKMQDDKGTFANFEVIYPPIFKGTITLDHGSYFYATKKPAGFTFKVK